MKVAVAGHTCLDIIPDWQKGGLKQILPGHTLEMEGIKLSTGGCVPNTGLALEKLGVTTSLFGKIGDDPLGRIVRDLLQRESPRLTANLISDHRASSSYTIVLSPPETDRAFLHSPAANDTFNADDIPAASLEDADLFHFGYPPLMRNFYTSGGEELRKLFAKAAGMDCVTSLDLALPDPDSPAGQVDWENILQNVLPAVDLFLPSLDELAYMLDRRSFVRLQENAAPTPDLLRRLSERALAYGASVVIIKLGADGLFMRTGELRFTGRSAPAGLFGANTWSQRQLLAPGFKTEPAGTTGAGDASIAGFIAALLEGKRVEEVLNTAAAVGACSVESMDATGGIESLERIEARIAAGWERRRPELRLDGWSCDQRCGTWRGPEDSHSS